MKENTREMIKKVIDSNPFTYLTIGVAIEKIEDIKLNKQLKKDWENKTGVYSYLKK